MLKLANEISEVDTLIAEDQGGVAGTTNALTDGLILKIERKQLKDLDEFSGRFFVKVVLDQTTSNISQYNLISQIADDYVISAHAEMFWLHDTLSTSTTNVNSTGSNQSHHHAIYLHPLGNHQHSGSSFSGSSNVSVSSSGTIDLAVQYIDVIICTKS